MFRAAFLPFLAGAGMSHAAAVTSAAVIFGAGAPTAGSIPPQSAHAPPAARSSPPPRRAGCCSRQAGAAGGVQRGCVPAPRPGVPTPPHASPTVFTFAYTSVFGAICMHLVVRTGAQRRSRAQRAASHPTRRGRAGSLCAPIAAHVVANAVGLPSTEWLSPHDPYHKHRQSGCAGLRALHTRALMRARAHSHARACGPQGSSARTPAASPCSSSSCGYFPRRPRC